MAITNYAKLDTFKHKILALPQDNDIVSEPFLLEKSEATDLHIYYSPIEYLNTDATILIVGITPGLRQMKKAYASVQANSPHHSDQALLHQAKVDSSYEGPMRKNLVKMLDGIGLPKYLSIPTAEDLFGDKNHLVHTTGLLPYPVFYKGKNFTGSTPNIWKTPMLKKYVMTCFLDDITRLQHPLLIPLGVNVARVLQRLADLGWLPEKHILFGFPHPSGANGHRHKQFKANKARMQQMLADYFRSHTFNE